MFQPVFEAERQAGLINLLILALHYCRTLWREYVAGSPADDPGFAKPGIDFKGVVAAEIDPIAILAKDQIRDGIDERSQQSMIVSQSFFDFFCAVSSMSEITIPVRPRWAFRSGKKLASNVL